MGLVPSEARAAALGVLVRDIETTHKGRLSTGIFGTKRGQALIVVSWCGSA